MRGNWDQTEPLVLAPEQHQQLQQQQHQQQQQTIVDAEHLRTGHPLHSPTTPAWGAIADRITVKDELRLMEDKNNDSSTSSGYYTRDSSSVLNYSISPKSGSSFGSKSLQISSYEFSPERHYKSCDAPINYARVQQLPMDAPDETSQHHLANQAMMTNDFTPLRSITRSGHEENVLMKISPDPLECPICNFSTQSRLLFTEHLASHCSPSTKCDTSEFTKSVMEQLTNGGSIGSPEEFSRASPTQHDRNSEHESEETDEPGLRVPRVNSQGKVKTFRCKQCNFVAITKLDFWEHSRCHIKVEKLLTCPKCPFVTEYKHHLEYHLRNHFGSKPYKCDKCSYSCVNKSMLNSHLKSHSNVYQFRCADCSYATKYCHSLKLHLRKYEHKPAMVLNADGSPNPLPIIDVYGTRRGPKIKSKKEDDQYRQQQKQQQELPVSDNGLIDDFMSHQVSLLNSHFKFNPSNGVDSITNNGNSNFDDIGLSAPPGVIGFSYNQLFGGFGIPPVLSAGVNGDEINEKLLECHKANFIDVKSKILKDYSSDANDDLVMESTAKFRKFVSSPSSLRFEKSDSSLTEKSVEMKFTPLDLSISEANINENLKVSEVMVTTTTTSSIAPKATVSISSKSGRPSGTSRRKGRAVKLDRRLIQVDSDDEVQEESRQRNSFETTPPSTSPASSDSKEWKDSVQTTSTTTTTTTTTTPPFVGVGMSNEFTCQYCEISFGNEVMHSVHMGYHGYQNPYTCNMCGIQCTDKVSFFLHIARSKH